MPSDGLAVLLQTLGAHKRGRSWRAICPAHEDHSPSLDVSIGRQGLPVVTCRVCGPDRQREVLAAIEAAGVPRWVWTHEYEPGGPADPAPAVVSKAVYEARDWNGALVATHHRQDLDKPDPKTGKRKRIWWERNGKKTLDGLSPNDIPLWGTELLRKYPRNGVVITEGEKDAGALRGAGVKLALATYGAESTPSVTVLQPLAGRQRYVLWPDNDDTGRVHMQRVAQQLVAAGCDAKAIQVVNWVSEQRGAGAAEYVALHSDVTQYVGAAPRWVTTDLPPADPLPPLPVPDPQQPQSPNGVGPGLRYTWAKDLVPTEVQWLWPGWLPYGRLAILQGDPGLGKSWFALAVATALSLGAPLPGTPDVTGKPSRTLLFSAEDDPNDTIAMRLATMGADPEHIAVVRGTDIEDSKGQRHMDSFTLTRHLEQLDAALEHDKFGLIVFDPLNAYFGATVDSYKDNEVRTVLGPLHDLVARRKVACLAIMHLTKGNRDKAIYRTPGSIAFAGLARVVMLAGREPTNGNRVAVVQVKNNLTAYPPPLAFDLDDGRVMWVADGTSATAEDLLAPEPTSDERHAVEDCQETVLDLLQGGRMESVKLLQRLHGHGYKDTTIRRARKSLEDRQAIVSLRSGGAAAEGKWFVQLVSR